MRSADAIFKEAEALSKRLIEADSKGNSEEAWGVFDEFYDTIIKLDEVYGEGFVLSALIAARMEDEERGGI